MQVPRGETGVWNEVIVWSLFSCFGQSINLMTMFYHYLIASHPNIVLFFYLFLYCVSAKYIFNLGGSFTAVSTYVEDNGIVRTKPSLVATEDEAGNNQSKHTKRGLSGTIKDGLLTARRIYPQTKNSPPVRYPKLSLIHIT